MSMNAQAKKTTDQSLIDAFLNNGGAITKGKTKPMPPELGISNSTWNNKLSKSEKDARNK